MAKIKESLIKVGRKKFILRINPDYKTIGVILFPGSPAPYLEEVLYVLNKNKHYKKLYNWCINKYRRKNFYKITKRVGMSGCKDYWLIIAKQIDRTKYYKKDVVAHIHISMSGKLNEGLNDIFIGDLIDIMESDESTFRCYKCNYKYIRGTTYEDLQREGFTTPKWMWTWS